MLLPALVADFCAWRRGSTTRWSDLASVYGDLLLILPDPERLCSQALLDSGVGHFPTGSYVGTDPGAYFASLKRLVFHPSVKKKKQQRSLPAPYANGMSLVTYALSNDLSVWCLPLPYCSEQCCCLNCPIYENAGHRWP